MEREPRLPPGQHLVDELPVLHLGRVPMFDESLWNLRIEGEVMRPRSLSFQEVRSLPTVISVSDFHCVTSWSRFDCAWEGVRFSELCDLVSPTGRARFVTIGAEAEYTTSLLLEDLMDPEVLLAWGLDGEPLRPENGYPLRLVVPHKYAYKSVKWVRWVRFTLERELGYWEQRGYSDRADPWREERYE